MTKKILVLFMAVLMLVACTGCPASEDDGKTGDPLVDNLFFHADFSKEAVDDVVGNVGRTQSDGGSITYVDDEELGRKVALFKNVCVRYLVDTSKMGEKFTMEAYVQTGRQQSLGFICGTYWFGSHSGVGLGTGTFMLGEGGFGYARGLSMFVGNGTSTTTVNGGKFKEWNHLVYVHDGEAGKDYYYVNGEDVTEGGMDSVTGALLHDTATGEGFRIGAYNSVGQFGVTEMHIAYVKLYEMAATAEQISTMYENR